MGGVAPCLEAPGRSIGDGRSESGLRLHWVSDWKNASLLPSGRRLAPRRGCGADDARRWPLVWLVVRPQIGAACLVCSGENNRRMDAPARLLVTVAFLTVYVIGIGGTTAAAIRVAETWRRRGRNTVDL